MISDRLIVQANAAYIPLTNESVQTVVCSPPFWGKRSYKTPPMVWGGEHCVHEWSREMTCNGPTATYRGGHHGVIVNLRGPQDNSTLEGGKPRGRIQVANHGSYCEKCGAMCCELGQEPTPQQFIQHLTTITAEIWRVLKDDGVFWINIGDSFAGGKGMSSQAWSGSHPDRPTLERDRDHVAGFGETRVLDDVIALREAGLKPKSLSGVPQRLFIALLDQGWIMRNDITWDKSSCLPESVTDRCSVVHESIYMCVKQGKYYFNADAIATPMNESTRNELGMIGLFDESTGTINRPRFANMRDVWSFPNTGNGSNHEATFAEDLPRTCILASSRPGDLVLDPFSGSGTTGRVAIGLGRRYFGLDLNRSYIETANVRTAVTAGLPLW